MRATDVAGHLASSKHAHSEGGTTWQPGYRCRQDSPRTVRVLHDGHDEASHLAAYAEDLKARGYTVTPERPTGRRPRLRVTHP
ncbi:hypothetical protein AVW11_03875 [Streptomyces amritsarensis]|uniref:Uncharacterized protein n=1 Tax=Streptomyces amritsarensis TaxID=681158 RepID=A0ABX3GB93_9ACTN|nr:hypothetical protein AVW11_03875 [Streptomyces amritsarensis]